MFHFLFKSMNEYETTVNKLQQTTQPYMKSCKIFNTVSVIDLKINAAFKFLIHCIEEERNKQLMFH